MGRQVWLRVAKWHETRDTLNAAAAELAHWDRDALEADPARWAYIAHHNL